eukprot:10942998-Lingulodinium_polyedra.AAC.1
MEVAVAGGCCCLNAAVVAPNRFAARVEVSVRDIADANRAVSVRVFPRQRVPSFFSFSSSTTR